MNNKINQILIVCTGNTARSPVGEYLGKFYAKKHNANLKFESAGFINAFTYMQPESQDYLNLKGINHSDFKPQIINRKLLEKHDLIITMEEYHASQIKSNFSDIPEILNKTYTIKEFNGRKGDIIDPYYTGRGTYLKVMKELDDYIEKTILKIIELNSTS